MVCLQESAAAMWRRFQEPERLAQVNQLLLLFGQITGRYHKRHSHIDYGTVFIEPGQQSSKDFTDC